MSGGLLVASPVDEVGDLPPVSASPSGSLRGTRRTSRSVSGTRPPLSTSATSHRTLGSPSLYAVDAGPSAAGPSAAATITTRVARNGLKRRISTPNLAKRTLTEEADDEPSPATSSSNEPFNPSASTKVYETRARSTSTSIVVPQTLQPDLETSPTISVKSPLPPPCSLPTPPWSGMYVTPPSPPTPTTAITQAYEPEAIHPPSGIFTLPSAYGFGEAVVSRVMAWTGRGAARRDEYQRKRRPSDQDSEKGLDGSEEDEKFDDDDEPRGKYWGLFDSEQRRQSVSYFTLPPTPPDDCPDAPYPLSLPTPTLSAQSLSHPTKRQRRASRAAALQAATPADGWWAKVYRSVSGSSGNGKTAEVLRELGWTVALLAGLFVVSFMLVLYAITSMPITKLKSMPKSTTDLQLLSAEMRTYMASGTAGWWHTVGVLTYIGCWKHAWSVPGAVVLNILVGSVFEPLNALALLTLITACGSLGAYLLSRPLAPLIAVLFPKPLALVRAALAPDSVPRNPRASVDLNDTLTPVQVSSDPSVRLGGPEDRPNVWRRLLLMRAMGFVPWSGMNVACGVVGVNWRTFWLTTAAGSASWSYVTASVGNILSRLAIPTANDDTLPTGESLTSLLRDPTLIAKLVFLTLLTLVPVLLKRRASTEDDDDDDSSLSSEPNSPTSPTTNALDLSTAPYPPTASPLAISLASFTPTPHMFDLLSFGRTAIRQGVRVVVGGARQAVTSAQRFIS